MRKVLFTVLALNMILEGLTSVRLVSLPFQKEDFDAALHGGFVLYGYAALAAAASIVWFAKYSYAESSLALGLGLLLTFHICMVPACVMISNIPGAVVHGLLFVAFAFLFFNRIKCLPVDQENL
ncbi:MAG TPA: hypothetical protein DDZ32_02110 [Gammaproteobacteria bacterium]|jgi:hypothetical protein|nr:hypothetical protein [Gammaproteobacteria bacterium]|tara:strand:+ start:13980 stop:14351 length:372 start_codon:yes stop_codon:yes gene_type:complete